jgi:hypothetical protein
VYVYGDNELRLRPFSPVPEPVKLNDPMGLSSREDGAPFLFYVDIKVPIVDGYTEGCEDAEIILKQSDARQKYLSRYKYLITLFINGIEGFQDFLQDRVWVNVGLNEGGYQYKLLKIGYPFTGDGITPDLAPCDFSPAPFFIQEHDYYGHLWVADSELLLPKTFSDDLERFGGLNDLEQKKFLRACYWYYLGISHYRVSPIAIVCFASAIECLLPQMTSVQCNECGKSRGIGVTGLFNKHLERYSFVSEGNEAGRKKLYAARSALVHGRKIGHIDDDEGLRFGSHHMMDAMFLRFVTQQSLVFWLRDDERSTWHEALV